MGYRSILVVSPEQVHLASQHLLLGDQALCCWAELQRGLHPTLH